jgi:hypothetical protein
MKVKVEIKDKIWWIITLHLDKDRLMRSVYIINNSMTMKTGLIKTDLKKESLNINTDQIRIQPHIWERILFKINYLKSNLSHNINNRTLSTKIKIPLKIEKISFHLSSLRDWKWINTNQQAKIMEETQKMRCQLMKEFRKVFIK